MPTRLFAAALLALLPLPRGGQAEDRTIALGKNGALYSVVAGRHGDLFPGGPAAVADNPALAMDIVRAGQPDRAAGAGNRRSRRWRRHRTWSIRIRSTPPWWCGKAACATSTLGSISRACATDSWSPLIDLQSDFWSWKSSPRIAITTESYQIADASGVLTTHQRTIIHTLWWEDAGAGERTVYSPVVFVDGKYIGWNPVQVLDELDTTAGPAPFAIAERPVEQPERAARE